MYITRVAAATTAASGKLLVQLALFYSFSMVPCGGEHALREGDLTDMLLFNSCPSW